MDSLKALHFLNELETQLTAPTTRNDENDSTTESLPTKDAPKKMGRRRLLPRIFMLACLAVGGMFVLSMTAKPPSNLGAVQGVLAECPDSPNCVSSQTKSPNHLMPAIRFEGSADSAIPKIKESINNMFPRAKLVAESDGYLRYEFTSLIFRFVDDVEFVIDDINKEIHFRSASRVGHSDLGANAKRMKRITEELSK